MSIRHLSCLFGLLAGSWLFSAGGFAAQEPGEAGRLYKEGESVALAWSGERLALATPASIRLVEFGAGVSSFVPFFAPGRGVLPLLAARDGFLSGVTAAGEVVVWDLESRREVGRRSGGAAFAAPAGEPVLALAPGGMRFLVGDGAAGLFSVSLDSPLPSPVGYPGPGEVLALGFDAAGQLRTLPSRWSWSPATGAWAPGSALDFDAAGGKNRLAWAPEADILAVFRSERPALLSTWSGVAIDLGYREPMDLALDPAGALAWVSFPGVEPEAGYGSGEVADRSLLGSLESFDAATGVRLAVLPREGAALAPNEAFDHRTLGLGLELAALGNGRLATVDFVDHKGAPSLFLRLRGSDLLATAEVELNTGTWPIHLAVGGGLLAVVYEEQTIDVFDLATFNSEAKPMLSLPIAAEGATEASGALVPRDVFAVSQDGGVLAMCGGDGAVFFANPRTGWPHQVISVNLSRGAGRPLAARFESDGGLTVVTEDRNAASEPLGLFERTLDATQTRWSEPVRVAAVGEVAADGKRRVELQHGAAGNLDVYAAAVADGELIGHLVARRPIGPQPLDALAISATGALAWARDGQVFHAELEPSESDAER